MCLCSFDTDRLLSEFATKNNNRKMRYEFGENTVKSKLWEVMLRQVHVKGARIVEKIEQHMTRNVALFIKNMWFNKQMKYNQYINALWQYRRKTYNLYGMPIDLFEYMYDFLTYDDSNQFDKTSKKPLLPQLCEQNL